MPTTEGASGYCRRSGARLHEEQKVPGEGANLAWCTSRLLMLRRSSLEGGSAIPRARASLNLRRNQPFDPSAQPATNTDGHRFRRRLPHDVMPSFLFATSKCEWPFDLSTR
jgi:hypothetical protein